MLKRFSLRYVLFSLLLDIACVVGALAIANVLRRILPYGRIGFYPQGVPPVQVYAIAVALWLATAFTVSLYNSRKVYRAVDEFQTLTLTTGFYALAIAGVLYFTFRQTSRAIVLYSLAVTWLLMVAWRVIVRTVRRRRGLSDTRIIRVLIVGAGDVGRRVAEMIEEYAWAGLQLEGYLDDDLAKHGDGLPVLGTLDDIEEIARERRIDDVILALPARAYRRINEAVARLHSMPIHVRVVPDYFSLALYRATVEDFGGIPMINLRDPVLTPIQRVGKRLLDLVIGGTLTLVAAPLMLAIALAIKLDSRGPVFFRQTRVGENGHLFKMLKFRSMVSDAEDLQAQVNTHDTDGNLIHKTEDDPRVTRVGRFIRRWSLDEFPQFLNVLKGDMSLIGPRPELPWLVDKYEPWQRRRFAVPQGITGWWQVNGRSDKVMHLHTDEDLYYIQNYSLWLDIYILLKTPWVILRGRGAY